jgi:hypothetical protein
MTVEDAIAEVTGKTPLTVQDIGDVRAVFAEDVADPMARDVQGSQTYPRLTLLVAAYRDAAVSVDRSTWDRVIDVLGKVTSLAGFVTGLTGVVGGVYGVVTTIKAG